MSNTPADGHAAEVERALTAAAPRAPLAPEVLGLLAHLAPAPVPR